MTGSISKIKLNKENFDYLISYLNKEFNTEFKLIIGSFNDVTIYNEENDTEFYIKSNYFNTFVLARINVSKKNSGVGSNSILILENIAKELGFKTFKIESTLSIEMNNLAKKLGFFPSLNEGCFIENQFYGNYLKDIK